MVKTVVTEHGQAETKQAPEWPKGVPVVDYRWLLYQDLELATCEATVDAADEAWVAADQALYEARIYLGEEKRVEEEAIDDLTADFGDLLASERGAICSAKSAGERAKQLDAWLVANVEWPTGVRAAIQDAKQVVIKAEHKLAKVEHQLKRANSRASARLRRLDFLRSMRPIAMENAKKVPEVAARVGQDGKSLTDEWVEVMMGASATSPMAQLALGVLPSGVDGSDFRVKKILAQIREANAGSVKSQALETPPKDWTQEMKDALGIQNIQIQDQDGTVQATL